MKLLVNTQLTQYSNTMRVAHSENMFYFCNNTSQNHTLKKRYYNISSTLFF